MTDKNRPAFPQMNADDTRRMLERDLADTWALENEKDLEIAKLRRDLATANYQLDRFRALTNSVDDDFKAFVATVESLGAMPEGYCFCSEHRIGDDSKIHEPECADIRKALFVISEKERK